MNNGGKTMNTLDFCFEAHRLYGQPRLHTDIETRNLVKVQAIENTGLSYRKLYIEVNGIFGVLPRMFRIQEVK